MNFSKKIDKLKYFMKGRPNVSGDTPDIDELLSKMTEARESSEISGGETPMRRERIKIDLLIHDLKVPLAVIEAGMTSILKRPEKYGPITEKQEKVFQRALRNTKVIQALVNDALELGRSREGKLHYSNFTVSYLIENALVEIFDLTDALTSEQIRECSSFSLLGDILKQNGVFLFVDEELWCMEIRQDEAKVRQILRNLLSNALKYRKKKVELNVSRTDTNIVISVKDDGDGIPATYHKKIFDCYFQIDATEVCSVRGHGLGLAGVMVLVEDLGGELLLDSDEGLGTRFIVKLPLQAAARD